MLTVAPVPKGIAPSNRRFRASLKGVPLLVELARRLPQYRFVVAGIGRDEIPSEVGDLPPNVDAVGYLSPEELRSYYRRAKVYAHPSLTEGLPAAVAEAMLCECVPVGSSVNGIPRLIGRTGFVVPRPDVDEWIRAIEQAMHANTGPQARERIRTHFSPELRCARLRKVIEGA